jgi:hypothetical protein|nr:hypothetical protein [Neorhizobium tomejilense]
MVSGIQTGNEGIGDLLCLRIKPIAWETKSQYGWTMFTADTEFGRFAYGTDANGQSYHQDNAREVEHPSEEAAKKAAEAAYRALALARIASVSVDPSEIETRAAAAKTVIELRELLARYAAECAEAETWGGPTIYPRNPIDQVSARRFAKALAVL